MVGKLYKIVSGVLWILILLIVLAYTGRSYLDFGSLRSPFMETTSRQVPIVPAVSWTALDSEIKDAVESAKNKALGDARTRLDRWHDQLMKRVDDDFLEWYFNYFNQQMVGLSYAYHWAYDYFVGSNRTPNDKVIENIQSQFANRVLRPEVSQMELEAIAKGTVEIFLTALNDRLEKIPGKFQMPQEAWERHLGSIAVLASGVDGDRSVPLTLKALTVGAGTAAGPMMVKAFAPAIKATATKLVSLVSTKAVSSAAAAAATTAGAKVAGTVASGFLGPIVAVGIISWDLWDHAATVGENRPIMRENISDYLHQFESTLLDADGSIGGAIHGIEVAIFQGMAKARTTAG